MSGAAVTAPSPDAWREANRRLLAKALGEWSFEQMLDPAPDGDQPDSGRYVVDLVGGIGYGFAATRGPFGDWRVDPHSVTRGAAGLLGDRRRTPAWDALQFVVDVQATLGTDAATIASYLLELSATLAADARHIDSGGVGVAELRAAGHAELDGMMTGHSWLVANKSRLGFAASDVERYAPESRHPLRLLWLAVHRGLGEFRGTPDRSEHSVLADELDAERIAAFRAVLTEQGLHPDSYVWLPVHPWQWDHAVQVAFPGEIAQRRIVHLGESDDSYLPGQSIRTVANISRPRRHDVKLPLKILNTSVWRGIPPHCSLNAPAVTQWLLDLLHADPLLRDEWRTVFLGEVASVTVQHPQLAAVADVPYQHLEMLGCIWRESVASRLDDGERARTFASLVHVDEQGEPFVAELVRASGVDAQTWLRRLCAVVLHPLLHVLYTYGLTFNPHGQNTLLTFGDDELPRRLVLKDFVDDVNVSDQPIPQRGVEPDGHQHVLPRKPPSVLRQYLVDTVLVGHFRYLAPLFERSLGVPETQFWATVRETVVAHHERFPDQAARADDYGLLGQAFTRYGLNRDRLVVTRYGNRALRHAIEPNGTVPNPLYRP